MPEIIVYSAFQAIVLLDMIPKKRNNFISNIEHPKAPPQNISYKNNIF